MGEPNYSATLQVDGKKLELPLVESTAGSAGIDISQVLGETGRVTLDSGFSNTASCESEITYIDGRNGILRYRGYPIEQLAKQSTFLETAYLLIYGELPTLGQYAQFIERIMRHRLLHEDFKAFFTAFPHDGHPMAILQAGIAGLATYYEDTINPLDPEKQDLQTVLLLAKVPTMIAYIAKRAAGLPLLYPTSDKSYTEDFLRLTFALPYQSYDIDPAIVRALDTLFILHADHEQNCSTSTVRVVGSAHANTYAAVSSGIGALSGPLHGGRERSSFAHAEADSGRGDVGFRIRKEGKEQRRRSTPDGVWPSSVQKLRPTGGNCKGADPRRAQLDGPIQRPLGNCDGARRGGARGRVFQRAQAIPQRRFLYGYNLFGDGIPNQNVHPAVCSG